MRVSRAGRPLSRPPLAPGHVDQEGVVEDVGPAPADAGQDEEKQAEEPLAGLDQGQRQAAGQAEGKERGEERFLPAAIVGQGAEQRRQQGQGEGGGGIGKAPVGGGNGVGQGGTDHSLVIEGHDRGDHDQHKGRVGHVVEDPAAFVAVQAERGEHGCRRWRGIGAGQRPGRPAGRRVAGPGGMSRPSLPQWRTPAWVRLAFSAPAAILAQAAWVAAPEESGRTNLPCPCTSAHAPFPA